METQKTEAKPETKKPEPAKQVVKGIPVRMHRVAGQVTDANLVDTMLFFMRNGRRCVASIHSPIVKFVELVD